MHLNYEIKYVVVVEIYRFRIWSIRCKIGVDHSLIKYVIHRKFLDFDDRF